MTLRRSVISISFIVSFLTPFMSSSVVIALPTIAKRFSLNGVQLNWINNAYLLATAVFLLPLGRLADIHGRKRMLEAGIVLFVFSSLLIGLSVSSLMLFGFRVMQGLASAMIFSTSVALLTSVIEPGERGRMLGINTAATYTGLSFGPVAGGFLTRYLGWRSLFFIPLLLVWALHLLRRHVSGEWADSRGEPFDWPGAWLYVVSLVSLMAGITFISIAREYAVAAAFAGLLLMALFVVREKRTASPLLKITLLSHNRVFAFSNLAALINYSATFAVSILVSLYLQNVKGMAPQNAGLVLLVQPLLQALFSPLAGRLADRLESRLVASAGMGLCTLGLFFFVFLTPESTLGFLIANLSLLGLGFAFFSSPNTSAIMGAVEKRFYGIAASMLATMRMVGQTLSSALFTLLVAVFMGATPIAPGCAPVFMKTSRATFLLFAFLCLSGVFASLARGQDVRSGQPD